MIGVQFVRVGGEVKNLTDCFVLDETFAGYDDDYKFATQMRIWNGDGYDFYGWAGTSGTDVDDDPSLDYTWTDLGAEAVTDVDLPANLGVWVNAEKSGTLIASGEVVLEDVTIDLEEGYNMVCNPFPQTVPVTSFGVLDASFAGYDDDYKFATQMRIWNGDGYDFYGWAGTSGTDVDDDPSLDNTWTDLGAEATDAVIPYGTAVWIKAEKAGKITFKAPAKE